MNILNRIVMGCALVSSGMMFASNAQAQAQTQDDWTWKIAPYAWLSGIDGEVSKGPVKSEFDQSFSDLVDKVEMAFALVLDGNNGEFGLKTDFYYVELEESSNTGAGKVTGNVEEWIVSLAPYVRVVNDENMSVDLGAGGRYVNLDVDLDAPMASRRASRNWVDPIVTARITLQTAKKCWIALYGDIGGFGVESDLTWQVALNAGYAITETIDLVVGYRHLDIDNEDGGVTYDAATKGAQVGLSFEL